MRCFSTWVAHAVMISQAFFETSPAKLVNAALAAIPPEGPFHEGMLVAIRRHAESPADWRVTRQEIHDKYYRYQKDD